MPFRRLLALATILLLGGILAACGSEDDADPTPTPAASTRITSNQTGEVPPTPASTTEPTEIVATPAASASPVMLDDEVAATPLNDLVPPVPASSPDSSEETGEPLTEISGTLTLDGRSQQDYTLTPEGCVGVGEWRQLQSGTQVIVRNASGTVVDLATLEPADSSEGCVWNISLLVPSSDFFSISIPMVTEVWFDPGDPAVQHGEIELAVP